MQPGDAMTGPSYERRLRVAEGYMELRMFPDAEAELEEVPAEARESPAFLAVRLGIYQGLKRWELMQTIAKQLTDCEPGSSQWPISLAYATRRVESVPAARVILLAALERHPDEPIIYYNLACYDSLLGNLESATEYISRALAMAPGCHGMAMDDEDLKALWPQLRNLFE